MASYFTNEVRIRASGSSENTGNGTGSRPIPPYDQATDTYGNAQMDTTSAAISAQAATLAQRPNALLPITVGGFGPFTVAGLYQGLLVHMVGLPISMSLRYLAK